MYLIQDCYGGCTDVGQGYNGMLDEVDTEPYTSSFKSVISQN